MFKKKPVIKTLSPLRSSERRKIADRIISDFDLHPQTDPSATDDAKAAAAATQAHTALRNRILPDSALSASFVTTHGPDLREVKGTVYVGGHGPGEQRILWVKVEDVLYPSVYTLWQNPRLVPLVLTPELVVQKMKGGADLMSPGVAGVQHAERAKQGTLVAVASLDRPTVPVAIGTAVFDLQNVERAEKGRAVDVFHNYGDTVWDWSTSGKAGVEAPEELAEWIERRQQQQSGDSESLEQKTDALTLDANENEPDADGGGVSLDQPPQEDGSEPLSTSAIDTAFKQAFLYGVHHHTKTHEAPKYGLALPLTQSNFVSTLVIPYLPIHTPQQAEAFNFKKTTWKNARKFIKSLHKEKLVLAKDHQNEMLVVDIDFNDVQFRDFRPYRLPKKEAAAGPKSAETSSTPNDDDEAVGQRLRVLNLYRPREALAPLFNTARLDHDPDEEPKAYYTAPDIRAIVAKYIDAENLADANNKRLVLLNPFLANTVFGGSGALDSQVLAKGAVQRDQLVERVVGLCAAHYAILRNDAKVDVSQDKSAKTRLKAGAAPRIEILLETRGGQKTVTRVHGFEAYFIQPQPLAEELRRACAGSTSVEPFKGGKGMEVMVQGPQRDSVLKALEKRGVSRAWVDTVDKTKKK